MTFTFNFTGVTRLTLFKSIEDQQPLHTKQRFGYTDTPQQHTKKMHKQTLKLGSNVGNSMKIQSMLIHTFHNTLIKVTNNLQEPKVDDEDWYEEAQLEP